MAHLLDSEIVIDHLVDDPVPVHLVAPTGLAINAVPYVEAFQSLNSDTDAAGRATVLQTLVAMVPVLPFSVAEARRCAVIRRTLRGQGRRVSARALDLIIAATAVEHNLILVTRNVRDDRDIPGLVLYLSA